MNSRLDTIQAAVLQVKLAAFEKYELQDVNDVAAEYTRQLKDVVITPVVPESFYSSWAQYTIQMNDKTERDGLQNYLKEQKIPSMIYYQKPMHRQGAFAGMEFDDRDFQNTIALCERVLSLPLHPYMKQEDIKQISDAIKSYLTNNRYLA